MKALKAIGWRRLRLATQALFLVLLLLPLAGVPWFTGTFVTSKLIGIRLTDPFATAQVLVTGGALASGFLVILLTYLLLGRAFCSWVCPMGTVLEWLDRVPLKRALRKGLPAWIRWLVAFLLLGLSALFGISLFEWMSPQATFMRSLLFGAGVELMIVVAVVGFELFVLRRGWCRSLCPAGAAFSLLGRVGVLRVRHDREACNRCGECIKACPMDGKVTLLETIAGRGVASSDPWTCSNCGICIDICPNDALTFAPAWSIKGPALGAKGSSPAPANRLQVVDRRQAVTVFGGAVAVAALSAARPLLAAPEERSLLRPPGALPEAAFLGLCLRCGQCVQACPRDAIHLGHLEHGLSLGTPYISPRERACDLCETKDGPACVAACPTGALTLASQAPVRMGTATIDTERCLAYHGDVCRSCFVACPLQGKALFLEGALRPTIDPTVCTGCGLCEEHCIIEPAAITITPINEHA